MTTPHSQDKLDAMLRKVQALLAHAEDKGNSPEAQETYRQKAEALMFTYRIEENQLAQAGGAAAEGIRPVWRKIWVCRSGSEFRQTYYTMAHYAVGHVDAEYHPAYETSPEDGRRWLVLNAVGYEGDLRFSELLYVSMQQAFSSKMEPRYNPALSEAENAYVMRSAGMEGRRIAAAIWGDDSKPNRVKARKLFAQHASSIGEDPSVLLGRGNSVSTFRDSYAESFTSTMHSRLWRMRQSHGDKELVLGNRKVQVKEALYEKYPHLRPSTVPAKRNDRNCERCDKAKSGYCRDHQYLKPRAGRYVEKAYSSAGASRGAAAARSVELGSKGTGRMTGGSTRSLN